MTDLLLTLTALCVAAAYVVTYRRANRSYDRARPAQGVSDGSFAAVYKLVILGAVFVIVAGARYDHPLLLEWHASVVLRVVGVGCALIGTALFGWAARRLGREYSPCFDLRRPSSIVLDGPYRWVRHPIYSANLLVLAGAALLSGSAWVLLGLAITAVYYHRAAVTEERALCAGFPEYAQYARRTGRMLPRLRPDVRRTAAG